MKKVIRLTESDLNRIVRRVINEAPTTTFEDSPEGLSQFLKQTLNKDVNPNKIKKNGDVYVVRIDYFYSGSGGGYDNYNDYYKYNNGRFQKIDNKGNSKNDENKTQLRSSIRLRGIQDTKILSNISDFYSYMIDKKDKSGDWDNMRNRFGVELYVPSWQEYQLLQTYF